MVDYKQVYTQSAHRHIETADNLFYTQVHTGTCYTQAIHSMYKHMHKDYISFTGTQDYKHRLVICTGLYYIQVYMVYTSLHYAQAYGHYTVYTAVHPITTYCRSAYAIYTIYRSKHRVHRGLYTVYTGTSTLHRSELHRSYTVGQYEQAYTQATNMNRSDHIHAGYTGYTCIGSTIHRSIHGIDSTLVHGIHVGL